MPSNHYGSLLVEKDFICDVVPVGGFDEPEEIGELINQMANMKCSFHTGTIIKFAGGWSDAFKRPV